MKTNLLLLFVLFLCSGCGSKHSRASQPINNFTYQSGAIVRGDSTEKSLALVFTGDEFAEGGEYIRQVLGKEDINASYFFTGNFYRNPAFAGIIKDLKEEGHYLGAHSDRHLLYCDWAKRDSLLVTREEFSNDLLDNYKEMKTFGIEKEEARFFLPPYEWYNDSISAWTKEEGLQLVNITYGTLSHADYTSPEMASYRSSEEIFNSILKYEESSPLGLNGFILLVHIGVGHEREDKFYKYLDRLIPELKSRGYSFKRIDELLLD